MRAWVQSIEATTTDSEIGNEPIRAADSLLQKSVVFEERSYVTNAKL